MKIHEDATPQEVRDFYESDLPRRLRARTHGNLRIDRATDFVCSRLDVDGRVLEIGCGIGVATERIGQAVPRGRVWAVDISPVHIDYCTRTIDAENISFHTLDILADDGNLEELVASRLDAVVLIDVIEHLPRPDARRLFERLARLLGDDGKILATFPSATYQRHLYETHGARIQAVDLILELSDIAALAERAQCHIHTFAHVDVWRRNQYVHCEMVRRFHCHRFDPWEDWTGANPAQKARICAQFLREKARRLLRPLREHKYAADPPGEGG